MPKVYVVIRMYQGLIDRIEVTTSKGRAEELKVEMKARRTTVELREVELQKEICRMFR